MELQLASQGGSCGDLCALQAKGKGLLWIERGFALEFHRGHLQVDFETEASRSAPRNKEGRASRFYG